ncbi:MAG: hypothetical protein ACJ75R_00290 [Solirubrobacterales bacterium]
MAMVIFEATGPKGEELAMAAGESAGVPVGWDDEFSSATFDSDSADPEELEATITGVLDALDPDWRSHLRAVD